MEPTQPSPKLRKPRLVRQTNTPVRSPPPVIRTASDQLPDRNTQTKKITAPTKQHQEEEHQE